MKKKTKKSHVKVGDKVKVISGSQKGFLGNILSISRKNSFVILEGILPRIKYIKAKKEGSSTRIELPINIHISNVMLWDSQINKAYRIGYKIVDGKKIRYFKKSGNFV